jgi:hypothetical protein
VTLTNELRMASMLICWLEDTVESRPRRAGATPEELADDYLHGCVHLANSLDIAVGNICILKEKHALFPTESLSRPALSAWRRLVTLHLPHLPLPARLYVYTVSTFFPAETGVSERTVADLLALLQSGEFMLDIGRGVRLSMGPLIKSLVDHLVVHLVDIRPLFSGPFPGIPRRLALLFYTSVSDCFDPQQRNVDRARILAVSPPS